MLSRYSLSDRYLLPIYLYCTRTLISSVVTAPYIAYCRIIKHLGCPNHCNENQKISAASSADALRSQSHTLLTRLRKINMEHFENYLQSFVQSSSIADVLEFFHAFCGFCVDPCSLLSPSKYTICY